jgi:acyl-CoA thioesterase
MDWNEISKRVAPGMQCKKDIIMELYGASFARWNGIEIEEVSEDTVRLSMELRPEHMNSNGVGHGGSVFALLDHTFAFASNMGCHSVGQSNNVIYHRPAVGGTLFSESKLINESKSLCVYEVRVLCGGKLIASAVCTGFKKER